MANHGKWWFIDERDAVNVTEAQRRACCRSGSKRTSLSKPPVAKSLLSLEKASVSPMPPLSLPRIHTRRRVLTLHTSSSSLMFKVAMKSPSGAMAKRFTARVRKALLPRRLYAPSGLSGGSSSTVASGGEAGAATGMGAMTAGCIGAAGLGLSRQPRFVQAMIHARAMRRMLKNGFIISPEKSVSAFPLIKRQSRSL